jgi:hypothetical protein
MAEWQPIDTAPLDGTPFLAYCPKAGRVVMRQSMRNGTLHVETHVLDATGMMMAEPYLWQPLPSLPESKGDTP